MILIIAIVELTSVISKNKNASFSDSSREIDYEKEHWFSFIFGSTNHIVFGV